MMIRRSVFRDQLHIFGLSGIAVAYPIFTFLLANPAYLVANRIDSHHLYFIIALPIFILPAILSVTGLLLHTLGSRVYRVYHLSVVGLLFVLAFLPIVSRAEFLPVWLVLGLAAVLAGLVTREYHANLFTYTGLLLLVPLSLALTAHFAMDRNISQVLNPKTSHVTVWKSTGEQPLPPVVMIVFDEMPLVHLLDGQGNIDRARFPNFAALGDESTWYANASTVYDQTIKAVPAILTGLFPRPERVLPVPENYPRSLFAVLRNEYNIHAVESLTALANVAQDDDQASGFDATSVTFDMAIFYLRSLLPTKAADAWLPLKGGIWGGFLSQDGLREWLNDNADWRTGDRAQAKRFASARGFIHDMGEYPRATFHYFHVALPHRPYGFLPSGRQYRFLIREDKFNVHDMSQGEIDQGRAAHILQVGLADTILGLVKEKLVELGYWHDAMVVVVADHGQAYRAGKNNRIVTPENFGSVAFVPLFVKYPGQTTGDVDYSNVQTIDIAPTIFAVLGVPPGPLMDGRNLRDEQAPEPQAKTILSESGELYEMPRASFDRARGDAHAESVAFFSLHDRRADLFNFGPGLDYIGSSLQELEGKRIDSQVVIKDIEKYQAVDVSAETLPLFVQGSVIGYSGGTLEDVVVAIVINDEVRAVTTPYLSPEGDIVFSKIIPEDALQANNVLEAVLLDVGHQQ